MIPLSKLKQQFGRLSRVDKTFLIALVLRVIYAVIGMTTDLALPLQGLVRVFFIIAGIVFLVWSFPNIVRRVLWRVRYRLLVTWIFVGVVPIVLICALAVEGLFIFMGQLAGYMTTTEIQRQSELVRSAGYALAWSLSHRPLPEPPLPLTETFLKETSALRHAEMGAIVRKGTDVFASPSDGAIRDIPGWSKPDFLGLIKHEQLYYFGAHVELGASKEKTDVFLYQLAPAAFFKNLLPGVATILPVEGTYHSRGLDIRRTEKPQRGFSLNSGAAEDDPDFEPPSPPPGRGWWDRAIDWVVLTPTTDLKTGKTESSVMVVSSRPSLIIKKLFSTLGGAAFFAFALMVITATTLLIVEIVSALFGAKLTRSITRSVADLYEGTRRVQRGDFSHRIPVRKTKDQLSELGGSFNSMTARIQDLILEVKEKERLENELEIAREVQSRLFPKEIPRLKTLELWGGCQPARTVSGDYYDFLALSSDRAALAIGDISGKGISAALLMAHIQSALRSQLMLGNNSTDRHSAAHPITSPSSVLSILNDHLYTSSPPEKYATFFLGLYSEERGQLTYTNAGHLAPIVVRREQILRLASEGFPVGLFPGIQYEQQAIGLEPGDLLVAFTDGVTETPNRDGEEFGEQRLTELIVRHMGKPLDRIASEIIASVGAWTIEPERHDDTTLLLARRL